jgi:CheY-like chemotaxis protein
VSIVKPSRRPPSVPAKRILLVDDYPDALEVWSLYLQSRGYEVITAANGLDAVARAHVYLPDVIVLDLELPGISGFEAAVQLRSSDDTSSIPLLAATGYSHARQLDRARDSGFDSIVIKPCDPRALVGEIERLLQHPPSRLSSVEVPVQRLSHNR